MNALTQRSIREHLISLQQGDYTAEELLSAYLENLDLREHEVGAFLTLDRDGAHDTARHIDEKRANGEHVGALAGIPFALKDNFCTKGMRTTCASKMLEHYVPPFDATAVAKLKQADGVLLGKLNMDEFAMGSSTERSALGVTRNPLSPDRVPGGSSGGSAAAVAAGEVAFALGSDTGGSVRQPAAFCGVVGFKPTYGAISRYGLIAMASSLDSVGILARTVDDAETVYSQVAGFDVNDATSRHTNFCPLGDTALGKLRVGVVRELMEGDLISSDVKDAMHRAIAFLSSQGAVIEEVTLPDPEAALAAYCVISAAESSSNLARYDGICYGHRTLNETDLFSLYSNSRAESLGEEVKRRILFGGYMLSKEKRPMYYERACRARIEIRRQTFDRLKHYDLLLTPSAPTVAFLRGEVQSAVQQRMADMCSVWASLAGLPAISIPFGRDACGLPIGIQLTAKPFAEAFLLSVARRLEEAGR